MSNDDDIIRRKVKRDAYCRGCDTELRRDVDECIYTYSWRNRGQSILFCLDCAKIIAGLLKEVSYKRLCIMEHETYCTEGNLDCSECSKYSEENS